MAWSPPTPVNFDGKENYLRKCANSTYEDVVNQRADLGCVVCWKLESMNWGVATGIKLESCSTCHGPRLYCSRECFEVDWNEFGHKDECQRLAAEPCFECPNNEAEKMQALKTEANELFRAKKYKEAIAKYMDVKIGAIQIRKFVQKDRIADAQKEAEKRTLPDYLKPTKTADEEDDNEWLLTEEDLKLSQKPHPLEQEMSRLSAIAANNTAITYLKQQDGIRASAAAREALNLDPLFAHRILPQLVSGMALLIEDDNSNGAKELLEMANRRAHYEAMKQMDEEYNNETTGCRTLYDLGLISYHQYVQSSDIIMYQVLENDEMDIVGTTASAIGRGQPLQVAPGPFGETEHFSVLRTGSMVVTVRASIIPFREGHWLTMGHLFIEGMDIIGFMLPAYQSLRCRPIDIKGSADDVDSAQHHPRGSISHIGTIEGLKKAHREIVMYVNELEREGFRVRILTMGSGLFDLLPRDMDPQKSQRKPKKEMEKFVLRPGHWLPPHTKILPAIDHIKPNKQMKWRTKIAEEIESITQSS